MYKEFIDELNNLDEDMLFEMANMTPQETGLPYKIWFDSGSSARNLPHSIPRVKIQYEGSWIPITISDSPEIPTSVLKNSRIKDVPKIQEVKDFIIKYKDILLKHWQGEFSDFQLMSAIVKDRTENK